MKDLIIDAGPLHYRDLNQKVYEAVRDGVKRIVLNNVLGQRFIGDNLAGDVEIEIHGVPGNDLGIFMDGLTLRVYGNAQEAVGNTMNAGRIVIRGNAGDITGHSMRGGRIYVHGDVGYRVGIHMKAYQDLFPVLIAGGRARDFLGEYMAGGLLVVLGLDGHGNRAGLPLTGDLVGTGMHGGTILIRGEVDERTLGKEVKIAEPSPEETAMLRKYLREYCAEFGLEMDPILKKPFVKLYPYTHRPYGKMYAY